MAAVNAIAASRISVEATVGQPLAWYYNVATTNGIEYGYGYVVAGAFYDYGWRTAFNNRDFMSGQEVMQVSGSGSPPIQMAQIVRFRR